MRFKVKNTLNADFSAPFARQTRLRVSGILLGLSQEKPSERAQEPQRQNLPVKP